MNLGLNQSKTKQFLERNINTKSSTKIKDDNYKLIVSR